MNYLNRDLFNPVSWFYLIWCKASGGHGKRTIDGFLKCERCGWPMYYSKHNKVILRLFL